MYLYAAGGAYSDRHSSIPKWTQDGCRCCHSGSICLLKSDVECDVGSGRRLCAGVAGICRLPMVLAPRSRGGRKPPAPTTTAASTCAGEMLKEPCTLDVKQTPSTKVPSTQVSSCRKESLKTADATKQLLVGFHTLKHRVLLKAGMHLRSTGR